MAEKEISIGDKFGAWKVIRTIENNRFLVICTACGIHTQRIRGYDLRHGKTLMCKSCSHSAKKGTTIDDKTKEVYNTWTSMKDRCLNPNCKDYKNYGGRGITIYPLWIDSFEAFLMHVGFRPSSDCTVERIDYEKGYFPGNVKWIPRSDQSKNKRDNIRLNINGKNLLVSEWPNEPECSVNQFTIYKRLARGWAPEDAVLLPSREKKKKQ